MKDLFLQKGLLTEDKKSGLQGYSIKKLFKSFLKLLNVPHVDDCCEGEHTNLPTAYNEDEEQIQYYNPDTKEWEEVVVSGGGASERFGFSGEDDSSSENRDFSIGAGMTFNIHTASNNSKFILNDNYFNLNRSLSGVRVFDIFSYSILPPINSSTTGAPDNFKHSLISCGLDGFPNLASHGFDFRSDGQLYYYNNIDNSVKGVNNVGYKLIFPVGSPNSIDIIAITKDIGKTILNEKTSDYTLVPTDFVGDNTIMMTVASPNTITIDDSILSTVEVGHYVKVIQSGPGNTSFNATGGTSLEVLNNGVNITGKNGLVTITKVDVSTFHICGDIIP